MLHSLSAELDLIHSQNMKDFAIESINKANQMDSPDISEYVKGVMNYLVEFCEVVDVDDNVRDVVLVAGLVHGLEFEPVHDQLQPLHVRLFLTEFMPTIGRESFDSIMYLVARQKGFKSIYAELSPQLTDPIHVWMLPMAIALADKEVT